MDCIANTVYVESQGEGERGMRAVAHVILNRAKKLNISPCAVVNQRGQFAQGRSRPSDKNWQLAKRISIDPGRDFTGGATHFHNLRVRPRWNLRVVFRFGNHIFYK